MAPATFFSPSYIGDLDRVVWLRRSIEIFFRGEARHIIATPNRDLPAFRNKLGQGNNLELLAQEELVDSCFYPDWIYRVATRLMPSQLWRLNSHAGSQGWIIQQVVKLNSPSIIDHGAIVFLDSDLFFVRPFDFSSLGIDGRSRQLVRITPDTESGHHRSHMIKARTILKLPTGSTDHHYMSHPAIWYPDWVCQLQEYLESVSRKPWQEALHDAGHFSEYILYGVFVEEILKPGGLQVRDRPYNIMAWDLKSYESVKVALLSSSEQRDSDRIALVVQSNLGIPTTEYEDLLRRILEKGEETHGVTTTLSNARQWCLSN